LAHFFYLVTCLTVFYWQYSSHFLVLLYTNTAGIGAIKQMHHILRFWIVGLGSGKEAWGNFTLIEYANIFLGWGYFQPAVAYSPQIPFFCQAAVCC
jgi:hypothetical protein